MLYEFHFQCIIYLRSNDFSTYQLKIKREERKRNKLSEKMAYKFFFVLFRVAVNLTINSTLGGVYYVIHKIRTVCSFNVTHTHISVHENLALRTSSHLF